MDIESALEQAASATLQGNKARARSILAELVMREPRNELAWLMLAEVAERTEHAIFCFERVLKLNPSHKQALRRLEELKQGRSPQAQPAVYESTPRPVQSPSPKAKSAASQPLGILQSQLDRLQSLRLPLTREWLIFGVALSIACIVGICLAAVLAYRGATIVAGILPTRISATTHTPLPSPAIAPTVLPTSTFRPTLTEKEVRSKLCRHQPSETRGNNPDYEINQSNGIVTVWILYLYLGQGTCATNDAYFLITWVTVENYSNTSVHVNPLNFTLIDFNGRTYNLDSDTFRLSNYFEATNLLPGTYTTGQLEFTILQQTPRFIVYDDGFSPIILIDLAEELSP